MMNQKIACVCVTANRPKQLGRMIRCFERQDYPNRELVILDDLGQYQRAEGDRWVLVTTNVRFKTLGEKRNAATRMVSSDVEWIAVWDDDDLYLPWALSATALALQCCPLSRPSLVLHPDKDGWLHKHETFGRVKKPGIFNNTERLFHSGWGYQREWFWQANGYPAWDNGEDQFLLRRLRKMKTPTADPIELGFDPFLIYPWKVGEPSHCGFDQNGYANRALEPMEKTTIEQWIADPPRISLKNPRIAEGIDPRVF